MPVKARRGRREGVDGRRELLMTDGYTSIERRDALASGSPAKSELLSEGRLEFEPGQEQVAGSTSASGDSTKEAAAPGRQSAQKSKTVPHLTAAERAARGKAAR